MPMKRRRIVKTTVYAVPVVIGCHLVAVDIGDSCGHGDGVIAAVTAVPSLTTESASAGVQIRT
jgi:hypothetical protein